MNVRQFTDSITTALQAIYAQPEAQAIAALVAEHLLQMDALKRMMDAQKPVAEGAKVALELLLARLLAHEPVQYVLGTAHFAEMELEVTPATLIPRPETEELVYLIKQEQASRVGLRVLDVGTGSGCLALALARLLPAAEVLAVDISAEALSVAQRNAARYAPQVTFEQLDILTSLPRGIAPGSLDVLVSNPPYVRESERPEMRDNVLAWEPATALFVPDADPLLFYRRLAEVGRVLLRAGGSIYLEINEALGAETASLLTPEDFEDVRVLPDMFGKVRVVRGIRQ
ncbi:peptide chain release factor N(5)-glutamine methyltransferase [Microvirga sp. STS02]|uniref:peptide chain release factor N(5)-glutamine methyltransferase n=1 Tax=Hymenobacter negativus TaxID=2795026 RepID=UPI0018DC5275|nr:MULTISPECIES: peptide chain release factor N(5)-glutamine methyltransferase [Bacteria]MBH8570842.1 peptide chain release factor N(5)-glutamine methyltransferase [Hymenobacter negativus]MBR7210579.1 peptide chain release factor N(5)-glutamine methyltransferase [Microvirga sp. STS02]